MTTTNPHETGKRARPFARLTTADRCELATRTSDETVMLALAGDSSRRVQLALTRRSCGLPQTVQLALVDSEAFEVCVKLTERRDTPAPVLAALATRSRWRHHLHSRIAKHPNTDADTLEHLMRHEGAGSVIDHPNLPAERLRHALQDPATDWWHIRRAFLAGRGEVSWYRPADLEGMGASSSCRAGEYEAFIATSGNPGLYRELAANWSGTADQLLETIAHLAATAA